MKFPRFLIPATLGLVCFSGLVRDARAATITWGTATTISGDTDVSTSGTFDRAINIGGTANTTVNGVTFTSTGGGGPDTTFTAQNTTFSDPSPSIYRGEFFSSTSAPFNNLSTNYKTLLASAAYNNGANPMTVSLGALTSGKTYQVQVWVDDSRAGTRTEVLNGGGNNVTLDFNTTDSNGGLGQFVLGTFTADSTSQAFTITNPGQSAQINALQLRTLATPEPATYAMMAIGCLALCALGAKRKKDEQTL